MMKRRRGQRLTGKNSGLVLTLAWPHQVAGGPGRRLGRAGRPAIHNGEDIAVRKRIAVVLSTALVVLALGAPTASADPDNPPDFKMPFPCGQAWAMFTYEGHGPADGSQEQKRIDMQWPDGETDGADVVASAGGTVSHVEPGGVHIDHGNGWFSQYLHMSDRVEEGKVVKEGDWIGNASNVGTNDPHLHYQQMYDFDGNGYPTEGATEGRTSSSTPSFRARSTGSLRAMPRISRARTAVTAAVTRSLSRSRRRPHSPTPATPPSPTVRPPSCQPCWRARPGSPSPTAR